MLDALAAAANVATILATGAAFYVYWRNRDKVAGALNALRHYRTRITVSELIAKLDRLNRLRPAEISNSERVRGLLADVQGQIEGHSLLRRLCESELRELESLTEDSPANFLYRFKRLVSRLREMLRHHEIEIGQEE